MSAKIDEEAVEYALRSVLATLDPDLHSEIANPKGFSVYPDVIRTFVALYEEFAE